MKIIKHSIPSLGEVTIELKGYQQIFFNIMDRNREVTRLAKLAHLGTLQDVFLGIRHTRWDYTIAMLHIIQQLSEAKVEGLSTNKKVQGLDISGRDMMQLLALAANIGHLPGTFAVEKGVMRYLLNHSDALQKLCNKANLSENQFRQVDYISLNKVLLLVKLQLWLDRMTISNDDGSVIRAVSQLVQEAFISGPTTNHREKILYYFHNIVRRVSYQLFDCLYVNLPIRIDYNEFINRLSTLPRLPEEIREISELTDYYTRIVYKRAYHSENACRAVAIWADEITNLLEKKANFMNILKKWLERSELSDPCNHILYETNEVFSCMVPHNFAFNSLTEAFKSFQVDELENRLKRLLGPSKPLIMYIPDLMDPISRSPSPGELLFKVYDNSRDNRQLLRRNALILVWTYRQFKHHWGIGLIMKSGIERLLSLMADKNKFKADIVLAPDRFFKDDPHIWIVPEDKLQILSSKERRSLLECLLPRERRDWDSNLKEQFQECKFLREVARRKWRRPRRGIGQYWAIIPGRVTFIHRRTGNHVCEFDGALLNILSRARNVSKLVLCLLESKAGKKAGMNTAKNNLKHKVDKLGIHLPMKLKRIRKNAYAEIDLLYN
jgi:hypothetical protein